MLHPTYEVRSIRSRPLDGVTQPSSCTLEGVMKFDSAESPHCVYNEAVAVRLAQTIHAPVADGVLTVSGDGHVFVSLALAAMPDRLPNLHWKRRQMAAARYPEEVAALAAFDMWIGNADRYRNLKASVANPQLHLFRAFDHSHALLAADGGDVKSSLAALKSKAIIATRHPFYGLVDAAKVLGWAQRIAATPNLMITECCAFGRDFRSVPVALQNKLAKALITRKDALPAIVHEHASVIATLRVKEEG